MPRCVGGVDEALASTIVDRAAVRSAPARTAAEAARGHARATRRTSRSDRRSGRATCRRPGRARSRTRARRSSLNEPMQTRSTASSAASDVDERLDRGVVLRVDVDAQVGPRAEQVLEQRDRLAAVDLRLAHDPTTAARRCRPVRSVTRSRTSSWNASSTPSAVTCTSVST